MYPGTLLWYGGRHEVSARPPRSGWSISENVISSILLLDVHSFPANPDDPLPFDITEILLEGEAGSWPFLADGAGQIGIADHARTVYDDNYLLCPPGSVFGTLTAAILIITYDSPISTESSTWGAIKGIYL